MTPEEAKNIAKVEVREYFDHFLMNVYPSLMLEHSHSCEHGKLLNKLKYIMIGMSITLVLLFPTVGSTIVNLVSKLKGV